MCFGGILGTNLTPFLRAFYEKGDINTLFELKCLETTHNSLK